MKEKINALCGMLGLGRMEAEPVPLSGGYLHRMLRVETARGIFAVKALNPEIMSRPQALENMRRGEAIAHALQDTIPLCAACGDVVQVQDTHFLVYPWVEGACVFPPGITGEHCRIMGHVLGKIHRADVRIPGTAPESTVRQPYDWSLAGDERLPLWDAAALRGITRLQARQVISHRDLDPKNVMWQGMRPCVIDWEAAGYVSPWQEVIELVNYWADDEAKARAMLEAYGEHMEMRLAPWEDALAAGMDSMLGWLHYNLNRKGGEAHVRNTMAELNRYEERAALLRRVLG